MEKELAELRERLAKVEEWKRRRTEIEEELNKVWVEGGDSLGPPAYMEHEAVSVDLDSKASTSEGSEQSEDKASSSLLSS